MPARKVKTYKKELGHRMHRDHRTHRRPMTKRQAELRRQYRKRRQQILYEEKDRYMKIVLDNFNSKKI